MADPISGTVKKSADGNVVEEVFEVSDAGAQRIRQDIPVGVGGDAIQRIPWNAKGAALVAAGTYVKRLAGQERCLRPVDVKQTDGTVARFHCSRACLSAGTDGERFCPEHDKEVFAPQQDAPNKLRNRVTNSAGIKLTDAESQVHFTDKEGHKRISRLEDGRDVSGKPADVAPAAGSGTPSTPKRARAPRTVAAPRRSAAPKGGSITVRLLIDELKDVQFIDILRSKIVEAINALPARNVAEMEDVIRVRERVKLELQEEGK